MELWIAVGIAAIVVLVIAAVIVLVMRSRNQEKQTERLKSTFGSEYDSTVSDLGQKQAEAELVHREERVSSFDLRPLESGEAARFSERWTATQAKFVDDPGAAIAEADRLIGEVMEARGYPVSDFDQRAADLSVTHSEFVENYRGAHGVATAHSGGEASTEDLRRAMVQYRWLFDALLEEEDRPAERREEAKEASTARAQ